MNKKITFKRLVAAIIMIFSATLMMNAQTTDFPWHVVVYENEKEVASHSIEIISNIEVNSEKVTFVLDNGNKYPYPITSTFAFEQRTGGGTAIKTVAAPQWNVYYANGNLHFTEPVNKISIYTLSGILVNKFSGNFTDVPVNLAKGVYIVQAGGKTAKLLVTNSGASASAQPIQAPITDNPITMRAASADYKQYWNITVGGSTTPIVISDVVNFYFTPDNTIVFSLKNGNNVELANYTGMKFDIQPVQTGSSNWDLDLTMKFGGASYVLGGPYYDYIYDICIVAIAKDYIVGKGVLGNLPNTKIMKRDIARPNFLTEKLGFQYFHYAFYDAGYYLTQFFEMYYEKIGISTIEFNPYFETYFYPDGGGVLGIRTTVFDFNGGTPAIPTTIKLNADDSLTMSFTDVVSKTTYSHTFPAP